MARMPHSRRAAAGVRRGRAGNGGGEAYGVRRVRTAASVRRGREVYCADAVCWFR